MGIWKSNIEGTGVTWSELSEWVNVINFVKCSTVSYHCVNACGALYLLKCESNKNLESVK